MISMLRISTSLSLSTLEAPTQLLTIARDQMAAMDSSAQKSSAKLKAEHKPSSCRFRAQKKTLSGVARPALARCGKSQLRRRCRGLGAPYLPAKNTLHEADARQVEEAFAAKLAAINSQSNSAIESDRHDEPQAQPTNGDVAPAKSAATDHALEAIDKSELAHPEPRRVRDKDHLRFVSTRPCLICGRTPTDAHHLRFVQSRALGRKVSDEWVVALCRGHHREVHHHGDERDWWEKVGIDPDVAARSLWLQSHPKPLD
jgi:hypothetical protein